jgi:glyoxylase-like metal-dependent hydrolase (beta-lactamase superfamily II)
METTPDLPVHSETTSPRRFAAGVERLPIVFVNVYMVGEPEGPWVLVDTGMPGFAGRIRRTAESRFGGRPPEAIILTHGHFDHAGSVQELAEIWDVKVYAHRLEAPYLDGRSDYPPHDPTVGGALGLMSRTFPHHGYELGRRLRLLPVDGDVPGLPGWRWLPTPGHTAGHVSLFRDADGVLLAGDALATLNQDSPVAMVTQRRVLSVPPAPFTTDWQAAHASVRRLAGLRPAAIGAGHGLPVAGPHVASGLRRFAESFTPPRRGRYVETAAKTDENGLVEVPPKPRDLLPAKALAAGLAVGGAIALARRGFRRGIQQ